MPILRLPKRTVCERGGGGWGARGKCSSRCSNQSKEMQCEYSISAFLYLQEWKLLLRFVFVTTMNLLSEISFVRKSGLKKRLKNAIPRDALRGEATGVYASMRHYPGFI